MEPCFSIVDYVGWAIQRAYTTGDRSFFERIEHRVGMVRELKGRGKKGKIFNRKYGFKIGLGCSVAARLIIDERTACKADFRYNRAALKPNRSLYIL